MRIDGITVCVGRMYAEYLWQALPYWLTTLDSLTIVTKPGDDLLTRKIRMDSRAELRVVVTDVFTEDGAHFNKGAALNRAYAMRDPRHWVLAFDCDMKPPLTWRRQAEAEAIAGNLYGAPRSTRKKTFEPFGYFQLWHARDPAAAFHPRLCGPFSERYGHCGRYDRDFLQRWPEGRRLALPFQLRHLGTPCRHWHGVGNEHLTQALFRDGMEAYHAADVGMGAREQESGTTEEGR